MMKAMKKGGTTNNCQFIRQYDDVMTPDECQTTIRLAQQFHARYKGFQEVLSMDKKGRKDTASFHYNNRFNEPFGIRFMDWMVDSWNAYQKEYAIHRGIDEIMDPNYKIQHSTTGGGFTAQHFEQAEGSGMSERFAVWMIYLNDDFEGGQTHFPLQNTTITPKTGSLLIWPAAYTHRHHATNDLKGDKWIATGWFRFKTKAT